jgi:hypothetical protein
VFASANADLEHELVAVLVAREHFLEGLRLVGEAAVDASGREAS